MLTDIALTVDIPERGLRRGQVGTLVEELGPDAFEGEFSDESGRAYATLALRTDQFMVLHYHPLPVA